MQKEIEHPVLGKILYIKRLRSRSIRVSVNFANEIKVSMPYFVTYGMAQKFVDKNLHKINMIIKRMQARKRTEGDDGSVAASKGYTVQELESIRKRAHDVLPKRLAFWSSKLNEEITINNAFGIPKALPFSYSGMCIKNNKTNWGSCSSKRNINLNMHLVNLPQELMDFVIIHELCHLVHSNHGIEFHNLVNTICGGREAELQKQLGKYSSLLRGIK